MTAELWRNRHDPPDGVDPSDSVEFAYEQGIIGVGWPVEADKIVAWEEYERLAEERDYPDESGWVRGVNAIHKHMEIGDICYMRTPDGRFFLGRVQGEWRYVDTPRHREMGLVNVRECDWYEVPVPEESVPIQVLESFVRGSVLQRIRDERSLAQSQLLFRDLSSEQIELVQRPDSLAGWLNPEDWADILALYLQLNKNQLLLPATVRRKALGSYGLSTNREGTRRVIYGVQTDENPLPLGAFVDHNRQAVVVAPESETPPGTNDVVTVLREDDLADILKQKQLLPRRIERVVHHLRNEGILTLPAGEVTIPEAPGPAEVQEPVGASTESADSGNLLDEIPKKVSNLIEDWSVPEFDWDLDDTVYLRSLAKVGVGMGIAVFLMMLGGYFWSTRVPGESISDLHDSVNQVHDEVREISSQQEDLTRQIQELQQNVEDSMRLVRDVSDEVSAMKKAGGPAADTPTVTRTVVREGVQWVRVRIRWGDTLSGLLARLADSRVSMEEVVERNNLESADRIFAGRIIELPASVIESETRIVRE